jgi:beta-phosphoglucomutase-like phosphatase (HAD superfamily)
MKRYLFDFDGTLVNSMPTFVSVMLRILDENGIKYGDDIVKIITPLGYNDTAKYFITLGVPFTKEEIIEKMHACVFHIIPSLPPCRLHDIYNIILLARGA